MVDDQISDLKLYLFGRPRLERQSKPVALSGRKVLALAAYLATSRQHHSRDSLATLFWPDHDQTGAKANLRRELSRLNKILGTGQLDIDRERIGLSNEATLWLDVARFQDCLVASQSHDHPVDDVCVDCLPVLNEAAELYTADFLAGFTLSDSPDFDDWQFFQAERLRQDLALVLARLAHGYSDQGDFEAAISYARHWLSLDRLQEQAYRLLMRLYTQAGQQATALRQYEECVRIIETELGAPPSAETTALYEAIKAKRLSSPSDVENQRSRGDKERETEVPKEVFPPSPPSSPTPQHNLPPQATSFIGREAELAALDKLIANPDARLVTIIGPGGMGKSRLSIEAARRQVDHFADGVAFVPLAPVNPADLAGSIDPLVAALADALKLAYNAGSPPLSQLLGFLQSKQTLLVLDNFEHLLVSVPVVATMLSSTPQIKMVITSRERLNLPQEWLFPLHGLTFPEASSQVSGNGEMAAEAYSALQLFEQRARQAQPNFDLSAEYAHVSHICRLVEGLPLGIELAAAWVRLMPCQTIVAEIQKSIDFLATTMQVIPDRHRSLRAVFEHSWQLLSEPEQAILRKLSIFRGGFEREAAEAVAEASLWLLSALVDKSMLQVNPAGRYSLHELLRQLVEEKLLQIPGEDEAIRQRHAAYYAAFLQSQAEKLKGAGETTALALTTTDMDNIRLAWRWTIAQLNLTELKQAMEVLWLFYEMLGWFLEGKDAFDKAVLMLRAYCDEGEVPPETNLLLARGLTFQAWFATRLGDYEEAKPRFQESLSLLQRSEGDTRYDTALNRFYYAITLYLGGEYVAATPVAQQVLADFKALGDSWGIGKSLVILGQILQYQGHYREVERVAQEAIATLEKIGDRRFTAYALSDLGRVALARGAYEQANRYYQECLRLRTELGDQGGLAFTLKDLGNLSLAQRQLNRAKDFYQQSLAIAEKIGSTFSKTEALWGLGKLAHALGNYAEAKAFFQESLILNSKTVVPELAASYQADLGWTTLALAEYQETEQYFTRTMRVALDNQTFPVILDALVGLAVLLTVREPAKKETVIELLTLVLHHPACHQETKDRIANRYTALVAELPPEAVAAAQARAQVLDLLAVATEWLDTSSPGPQ